MEPNNEAGVFTRAEYRADAFRVMDFVSKHGYAVVINEKGKECFSISMNIVDYRTAEDDF